MRDVILEGTQVRVENPSGGMTNVDRVEEVAILFVENDPEFADMYRLKLEMDGYTVWLARDGEEALELLQREGLPDLLFLDIRPPRLDGIALLQRVRGTERTSGLPVVVLTNYKEEDLILQGLRLGGFESLIKIDGTQAQLSHVPRSAPIRRASQIERRDR